jgi:group II intron reverse transcriptase/maturase
VRDGLRGASPLVTELP